MSVNRRLLKEVRALHIQQNHKEQLENDYIVILNEDDARIVHALIKAPFDSVYRHKFVRLDIKVPDDYPHSPPEVTFINHDSVRIHPNMYENGKCCSTILNTWGDSLFEKWTSSMGIETILLTFHSFLDNNPYMYEPGGRDDPTYTIFVQYQSWITCLIRYLQYETIEPFLQYIHNYLMTNVENVFELLSTLNERYPPGYYNTRCFEVDDYVIDYNRIIYTLESMYNYIEYKDCKQEAGSAATQCCEILDTEYKCDVCFDTQDASSEDTSCVALACGHHFHKGCLQRHVDTNAPLCPMCRRELGKNDLALLKCEHTLNHVSEAEWMINPLTKRKIKVGGRTYIYLQSIGLIL